MASVAEALNPESFTLNLEKPSWYLLRQKRLTAKIGNFKCRKNYQRINAQKLQGEYTPLYIGVTAI